MENIILAPCLWPWLVFLRDEKLENQVFCDVVSDKKMISFARSSPNLIINGWSVLSPTNIDGWLLLTRDDTLCLWNIVTLKSIYLPRNGEKLGDFVLDSVFLTKSPDDYDCMILLLMDDSPSIVYCYVNGDDSWAFRDYQEELREFRSGREYSEDRFSTPFAYDEYNIFMISHSKMVVKIEFVKPKRLVIRHSFSFRTPYCHVVGPCRTFEYLVAWCRELFVVLVSFSRMNTNQTSNGLKQIVSINVFKLDFTDMSWKVVDDCPNVAFFICNNQCLIYTTESIDSTKAGNQIYIVDYDDNNDKEEEDDCPLLYIYHIKQKTLKRSLISTTKDKKFKPYWMSISDAQALSMTEMDYPNRGDGEKDQLLVKIENNDVMMVHKNYKESEFCFPTILDDLHADILKIILSHLVNPLDYLNFRGVGRSYYELGSAKEWRNITSNSSGRFNISSSPWLIFPHSQHVGKGLFQMVNPVSRNKYYVRKPEIMEETSRICYSAFGWLLLSSPYLENGIVDLSLMLYNPITNSTICLPRIPTHAKHFFFHATPKYENFFVIGISIDEPEANFYFLDQDSDEDEPNIDESDQKLEWARAEEMKKDDMFYVMQSNVNIIFVDNVYYFLVGDGNIAYFLHDEFIVRIHNLEDPCNKSTYERYFLARCDKDLLAIYIGKEWKWLRAFKFNESEKIWEEVEELKNNNCLYLSYVSSISSKPQSPEVGNRIYFSTFYQGLIIYYSFKTRKFHLTDGKDSVMNDYHGLEEQMYSCWFEPTWESL